MVKIENLVEILTESTNDKAFEASDILAEIGTEEVVNKMIQLLGHSNDETKILAARTLGQIENNALGLEPLLETIDKHPHIAGELIAELEGFDLSTKYVAIFKYTLSPSFKVSSIAQELLDFKEFDITARVIKKAKKAWNHYENNVKHDDVFELKRKEVQEMFDSLQSFVDAQ